MDPTIVNLSIADRLGCSDILKKCLVIYTIVLETNHTSQYTPKHVSSSYQNWKTMNENMRHLWMTHDFALLSVTLISVLSLHICCPCFQHGCLLAPKIHEIQIAIGPGGHSI